MQKICNKLEALLTSRANVVALRLQEIMQGGTIELKLRRILWTRTLSEKLKKWEQRLTPEITVEENLRNSMLSLHALAQFWSAETEEMRDWIFQNLSMDVATTQDVILMLLVSDVMNLELTLGSLKEKLEG
jgi:hypothetical protein